MNRAASLILLTLILAQISGAMDWRGVAPLRSTRADVERLLGSPQQGSASVYQTESERVLITYSARQCDYGWQVPLDTVVSFSVYPKSPPKFVELKLDESKFVKRRDVHIESTYYYVNEQEGINYTVDAGLVSRVEYYPSARDTDLRCASVKDSKGEAKSSSKFDEYLGDAADEKKRLDAFAAILRRDVSSQGFVIAYAGRRARINEAEVTAARVKNYLVSVRGANARQIVTMDGGYRERAAVELYLVSPGSAAPMPAPTLKPEEILIVRDRGKRTGSGRRP